MNADFSVPMLDREILGIVRSITKWTSRHITAEGFSRWCSRRGKAGGLKSGAVRLAKSVGRAAEAKALYAEGKTQQQIALMLGLNQSQVSRLLRS